MAESELPSDPHAVYDGAGSYMEPMSVAVHPTKKCFAKCCGGEISIHDIKTGKVMLRINTTFPCGKHGDDSERGCDNCENSCYTLAFSPSGDHLLVGGYKRVKVFNMKDCKLQILLYGYECFVKCVTFDPTGAYCVCCDSEGTTILWDACTWNQIEYFRYSHLERFGGNGSVAFSPDGKTMIGSNKNVCGSLVMWNMVQDDPKRFMRELWHVGYGRTTFESVAYSPDGTRVAVVGYSGHTDPAVLVCDTLTGTDLIDLTGFTDFVGHTKGIVWSVAFSNSGKYLISGGDDRSICVWDMTTNKLIRVLKGHTDAVCAVMFSPDDGYILSAGKGTDISVRVWDASFLKEIQ